MIGLSVRRDCWAILVPLIIVFFTTPIMADYKTENQKSLDEIGLKVHGGTPLQPTSESLLGRYIAESGAQALVRSYARSAEAQPNDHGPDRLFVSVTRQSFPIFQKYFTSRSFLIHYHEPHQTILTAAFNGRRGPYARLDNSFYFSYAGVLILPVLITEGETERVQNYFSLAQRANRWFDFAIHPWLLKNLSGTPYREPGNEKSWSDWFLEIPIGEQADIPRIPYDRDRVYADAEAVEAPIHDPSIFQLIELVWTAPLGHRSLGQVLNLDSLNVSTAGRTAMALLGSAGMDRLPVVFRFVNDHTDLRVDIDLVMDP